jgi:DNA-directed RNA polymerase subunit RPC12/RpoP
MEAAFDAGEAVIASDGVEWGLLADFSLIVDILTPAELRRHFDFETKRRGYICLTCSAEERDHQDPSRFAQLVINEGDQLFCPICTETHTVLREKCGKPGCRGSVLWGTDYKVGTCLTCNHRDDAKFRDESERYFEERRRGADPAAND